jgi:hypothetical protein
VIAEPDIEELRARGGRVRRWVAARWCGEAAGATPQPPGGKWVVGGLEEAVCQEEEVEGPSVGSVRRKNSCQCHEEDEPRRRRNGVVHFPYGATSHANPFKYAYCMWLTCILILSFLGVGGSILLPLRSTIWLMPSIFRPGSRVPVVQRKWKMCKNYLYMLSLRPDLVWFCSLTLNI